MTSGIFMMRYGLLAFMFIHSSLAFVNSAHYQRIPSNCNYEWTNLESPFGGASLRMALSFCAMSDYRQECAGVRCNGTFFNCSMISNTSQLVTCLEQVKPNEAILYIRTQFVHYHPELTVVDIEKGVLAPVSLPEFLPLKIPPFPKTNLQTQMGDSLVACMEETTACQIWKPRASDWTPIAPLNTRHKDGDMSLLSGQPIVVGGSDHIGLHGVVEIYNEQIDEWEFKPTIPTQIGERPPFVIEVNQTSVAVVGGHFKSMHILHKHEKFWRPLAEYPMQCWFLVCGLLDANIILCIGGRDFTEKNRSFAYSLNLSIMDSIWNRRRKYETRKGVMNGFVFKIRQDLYCMSTSTGYYQKSNQLQRMNLSDKKSTWKSLALNYPQDAFSYVAPYVARAFKIEF